MHSMYLTKVIIPFGSAREHEETGRLPARTMDIEIFYRVTMGILKAPAREVSVEFCDFRFIDLQEWK